MQDNMQDQGQQEVDPQMIFLTASDWYYSAVYCHVTDMAINKLDIVPISAWH